MVFNPGNLNLNDFLDELKKLAKYAFRVTTQAIIEHFKYTKIPPPNLLKKSMNQAQFEKGIYEQNVSRLQRELELKCLEDPDELQINNVTQQATQQNPEKPKPIRHHFRKPSHY